MFKDTNILTFGENGRQVKSLNSQLLQMTRPSCLLGGNHLILRVGVAVLLSNHPVFLLPAKHTNLIKTKYFFISCPLQTKLCIFPFNLFN